MHDKDLFLNILVDLVDNSLHINKYSIKKRINVLSAILIFEFCQEKVGWQLMGKFTRF